MKTYIFMVTFKGAHYEEDFYVQAENPEQGKNELIGMLEEQYPDYGIDSIELKDCE